MPLANYTSDMAINRIFDGITKMLVSHGARQISYDYDTEGQATGISFSIQAPDRVLTVKLPARTERVQRVLEDQRAKGWTKPNQAYRVGWKNIHDWVRAQLALLETEMVQMEEIFLPYLTNDRGQTLFEHYKGKGFELPSGEAISGEVIE
jgi:hypothetical protein